MSTSRLSHLLLFAVTLLAAPEARADIHLTEVGGGNLGKDTVITITGTPGDGYLLILSLTAGPTPLPPPHAPLSLDVGFELINLSFSIPLFLGTLPGTAYLPFSALPAGLWTLVDPLELHLQAVRHVNNQILEKSNEIVLTPNIPMVPEYARGTMPVRRAGYTRTALADGTIVFIGGGDDGLVASYGQTSIDVYDPDTQTFANVGQLLGDRTSHTATLLTDGRILVVGGADGYTGNPGGEPVDTAEVVDPANGYASTPTANNMAVKRGLHRAALLPDGRVLITGGTDSFANSGAIIYGATKSTEIYDPATNSFSPGPNMSIPRVGHSMTTLKNGQILIAGGYTYAIIPLITDKAQIYTPSPGAAGGFGGNITMSSARFGHTALLTDTGNVLLFGGANGLIPASISSVELFDATAKSFQAHGIMSAARALPAVCNLGGGRFLIAGGAVGSLDVPTPEGTIDIYLEASGLDPFFSGFPMKDYPATRPGRGNCLATLLQNGTVLLAGGGEDDSNPSLPLSWDDAEIVSVP